MAQFTVIYTLTTIFATIWFANAYLARYQATLEDGKQKENGTHISCKCLNGAEVVRKIDKEMGKAIIDNKIDLESCKKFNRQDVCGLLLSCTICTVRYVECYYPGKSDRLHCLKERYVLNDNYFETQKINSKSTFSKKSRRVKREIDACAYPKNLKTADVSCKTSKSTVNCTQKCIFGHTLKEGVTRTLTCSKRENMWRPSGFAECEPFVDCSVSLTSPGSVDCYTGTTRSSPRCYVSCQPFEDQKATPRRPYECKITGKWERPLPFCVTSGSGLKLAPAPKNLQLNDDSDYFM